MKEGYYQNRHSVEEYIKLAKDVNGAELIKEFKAFLPPDSTILEIGSGPGSDWEILNKNYEVTGSDYSAEFLKRLESKYPSGKFIILDAVTLTADEKYNGIYSNKVLHHLKDDELIASVKRQYEILLEDGIICHSFWKGEGTEIFNGLFVNYHTEKDLRTFFERYFDILLLRNYAEFEDADSLLLIGKRKLYI